MGDWTKRAASYCRRLKAIAFQPAPLALICCAIETFAGQSIVLTRGCESIGIIGVVNYMFLVSVLIAKVELACTTLTWRESVSSSTDTVPKPASLQVLGVEISCVGSQGI